MPPDIIGKKYKDIFPFNEKNNKSLNSVSSLMTEKITTTSSKTNSKPVSLFLYFEAFMIEISFFIEKKVVITMTSKGIISSLIFEKKI
ncbi:hypothetical protein [Lactobacillus helsingborgensis]|uniref:hypothetical protein n=1 Tax=Lactobacillus helsingborgensis TaxID=1218494 RepID=UPI0016503840|nr:hypothetical protein [Lactobacillus helsingborgensis]